MTGCELAGYIDQTLLKPDASEAEVARFLEEAAAHPFAAVCIPPCHVPLAADKLKGSGVRVCTVIGFPLGYDRTETKLKGAETALRDGADEIDMVMNLSAFLSGRFGAAEQEIAAVKNLLGEKILKVIIETCYLSDEQKRAACRLAIGGGADFVKTSTGFGPGGATEEDVKLLAVEAAGRIAVKASGGIKTAAQALRLIEAGAERIGTSSGIAIIGEPGG